MAKKRANGEGNIRKRADGRWEGRYTAGYRCLKELAHTAEFPLKSVGGREQVSLSAALSSRPICRIGSKAAWKCQEMCSRETPKI